MNIVTRIKSLFTPKDSTFFNANSSEDLEALNEWKRDLDYQNGLKIFNSLDLEPNCANFRVVTIGSTRESVSQVKEAISYFKQAIDNNPKNSIAWIKKGICHTNNGWEHKEADICFDEAIKLNLFQDIIWVFKGTNVWRGIGKYENQTEEEQMEKVKKCYEKALELNPNIILAKFALATIKTSGDYKDYYGEIESLELLLSDPKLQKKSICYSEILKDIGYCFAQLGNREKAIEFLDKALKSPTIYLPSKSVCFYLKGSTYHGMGNFSEALKWDRQSQKIKDDEFLQIQIKRAQDHKI
jgi:tetratricopeptide (TPR) repeat protein